MTIEQTLRLQCLVIAAKLGASGASAIELAERLYGFILNGPAAPPPSQAESR